MDEPDAELAPFRRFRFTAVRFAVLVTVVGAAIASIFSSIAAQGVLLGGLSGVLGFWIMASQMEKFALLGKSQVQFAVLRWSVFRMALYGAALYKSFALDRESFQGLIGAVAGILVIRYVLMFLGLTGWDLGRGNSIEPGSRQD